MSALTNKIAAEHQFVWLEVDEGDVTTAVPNCSCGIYLHETHASHVAEVTEAAVWSASLASVDLSNLTKPSRGDARRRAHVDRRTPVHPEDAWAFEQGVQAGVDAVFALLSDGEQQATRRAEAAVREASTTASDVIEGAMRMLDCGECAERLARLADQWRADEAAVLASVKPSRQAVARALGNARWGDQWFGVPDISLLRQADAILASDLLPGKTEAEVREQAIVPRAREHWEWAQKRRSKFGDQDCVCVVCELMANLTREGGQRS